MFCSQFRTSNKKFHWRGHVCSSGTTSIDNNFKNAVGINRCEYLVCSARAYHRHGKLLCVHQNQTDKKESTAEGQKEENVNRKDVENKENIFTVPNLLTGFRIVATPYLGYLVLNDNFVLAMGLFAIAAVTDGLDGYIARNFKNQSSTLGSLIDPLADKLLVSVLSITLTMANLIPVTIFSSLPPFRGKYYLNKDVNTIYSLSLRRVLLKEFKSNTRQWNTFTLCCTFFTNTSGGIITLMAVIVGRDVLLLVAALAIKYTSVPPPRTLSKLFDARNATVQMLPSTLSKVNTAVQLTLLTASLGAPVFEYIDHPILQILWYVTGATTIASGVGYAVTGKKNVRYIQKETKKKS